MSRRQRVVAMSTSEAEYLSAAEAAKEVLYLRYLLQELGCTQKKATVQTIEHALA